MTFASYGFWTCTIKLSTKICSNYIEVKNIHDFTFLATRVSLCYHDWWSLTNKSRTCTIPYLKWQTISNCVKLKMLLKFIWDFKIIISKLLLKLDLHNLFLLDMVVCCYILQNMIVVLWKQGVFCNWPCNLIFELKWPLATHNISMIWVLLDKLHEVQELQFIKILYLYIYINFNDPKFRKLSSGYDWEWYMLAWLFPYMQMVTSDE
jgi:hypothetical protein